MSDFYPPAPALNGDRQKAVTLKGLRDYVEREREKRINGAIQRFSALLANAYTPGARSVVLVFTKRDAGPGEWQAYPEVRAAFEAAGWAITEQDVSTGVAYELTFRARSATRDGDTEARDG